MSDTTKGHKAAKAPLLSATEFDRMRVEAVEKGEHEHERVFNAAASVVEFYEAKIASGELMVVPRDTAGGCVKSNVRVAEQHNSRKWHFPKFCPNCGKESPEAGIIEG